MKPAKISSYMMLAVSTLPAGEMMKPVLEENFEKGAEHWSPFDPAGWAIKKEADGNQVYEIIRKQSNYQPPHRSPLNVSLLQNMVVSDFNLSARIQTTTPEYGHRDCCIVFGYQDPAHFYYVHLGQKTDDHANQIFIVNGADRKKISTKTTAGTPWKDGVWHRVKVEREAKAGKIRVYFDDMETPAIEATDTTFGHGRLGLGSFDDTGKFDDIQVKGIMYRPEKASLAK
jgi:hypothetical protein